MLANPQDTPDPTETSPATTEPEKKGSEDGLDIISREMNKLSATTPGEQLPAATPATPTPAPPTAPTIPAALPSIPGAYNPEQEQAALRDTLTIADPERRMRVQQALKRQYANEALMDGITRQAREDAIKKSTSDYTTAVYQIQDDARASWQQKQLIAKELLATMWKDPRTDYGDTREVLEAHMLRIAGMRNTRELGPQFAEGQAGILDGKITDPIQLLKMEQQGGLAPAGTKELIGQLNSLNKPDERLNTEYQSLAFKQVNETILKDLQEFDPTTNMMKPSGKQLLMVNNIQHALLDSIKAVGQGPDKIEKIAKLLAPDSVDQIIERFYPRYVRDMDRVTRLGSVNVNGLVIPPMVSQDPKSQEAYRDIIVGQQPMSQDKEGKLKPVDQKKWQEAVNLLLANQDTDSVRGFRELFPGKDPEYIIRSINPVAPPPGYKAVPSVAPTPTQQASGFWGGLMRNLMPPRTAGEEAIAHGVLGILNPRPPEQEAKK